MRYTFKEKRPIPHYATIDSEHQYKDMVDKLGQLEDIEDELGIDLITLFKALTDGIWYKKEGHSLHTDLCLNVDKEWVISCWLKKYECIYCRLKDYGKIWALTREELE